MFFIVVSIVLFICLVIGLGCKIDTYNETFNWKFRKKQLFSFFALLILIPGFIAKVPANSVGIMYSPFGGTSQITLKEGFHFKNPLDQVYNITTQVQTKKMKKITTQTMDAQFINTALDVKFTVDSTNAYIVFKQYREIDKMSQTLIVPTVQRILELITTKYNVIDILGSKRNDVYTQLQNDLQKEFNKYGVTFYSISITDMDAGAAIEQAIVDEAVAKKSVETAKQQLLKVETEAKQQSVQAQAGLEATRIATETQQVQAEATKKANEIIASSLTGPVLQKMFYDKWNGTPPNVITSSGSNPFVFDVSSYSQPK